MQLIEGVALSELCDYSFGDQSGSFNKIYSSFMKEANIFNIEFRNKVFEIKEEKNYMTLFIDNIRLYKRDIKEIKKEDKTYVKNLLRNNDLLNLCSYFPEMNFIIFTNLEDTPIDKYIHKLIPKNVISIFAVNAISYGEKVIPAFYGLQRKFHFKDKKIENFKKYFGCRYSPSSLLYINHNEKTHIERSGIKDFFKNKSWVNIEQKRIDHDKFIKNIISHKFVVCPRGNAVDCHRNLEVIYLRRVPIMRKNDYLIRLYKELPVLWVDEYKNITKELLIENDFLFDQAQKIDLNNYTLPLYFNKMIDIALSKNSISKY